MTDFLHNGRNLGVTEVKGQNQSPGIMHEEMETQSIWQFPHSTFCHELHPRNHWYIESFVN